MMAAWIAASHLVAGRDGTLTLTVLGVTVVACILALVAWAGVPGMDLITFPASSTAASRRWATRRRRRWGGDLAAVRRGGRPGACALVPVLALGSLRALARARGHRSGARGAGPHLVARPAHRAWRGGGARGAGDGAGRPAARAGGAGAGLVALVGLVAVRYGTTPDAILAAINGSMGSDVDRVNTWIAAVAIAFSSPLVGGGWHSLERVGDFATRNVVYSHNILLHGFAEGGIPLGVTNATVILFSAWKVWLGRHTMAPYLIAAAVTCLVCGFWDMPQVRSYAAVMGGSRSGWPRAAHRAIVGRDHAGRVALGDGARSVGRPDWPSWPDWHRVGRRPGQPPGAASRSRRACRARPGPP